MHTVIPLSSSPHNPTDASDAAVQQGIHVQSGSTTLHHGGQLMQRALAWRLVGNPALPVVLVLGGISASRLVFGQDEGQRGWWNGVVGPGRALDSNRVRILGIDYLGGSGLSSRPQPPAAFPNLSSVDQADAIVDLLDHLGIGQLRGIVGASYGGMVGLALAQRHPQRLERLVVISAGDRAHPMATAWRSVQRAMLRFGLAVGEPAQGIELARALAMATYRSPEEFAARFRAQPHFEEGRAVFPVEEYLFSRGRDYATRYQLESFLCLSESIDLHQVDATRIPVHTDIVAVREDQLVPLADLRALAARLPSAQLHEFSSLYGHDAFLKEAERLKPVLSQLTAHTQRIEEHDSD